MGSNAISTIQFYGADLLVQRGETPETTFVAMKPVVEGMGLDWAGQFTKLKGHPVLSKGIGEISIPSAGGTQAMTALPLNRLHFWMATLHPNKIKDEHVREKVIIYQTEAADALFEKFFGRAIHSAGMEVSLPEEARRAIGGIVKSCAGVVVRDEMQTALAVLLPQMVNAALAQHSFLIRRGRTSQDILDRYGFPRGIRGLTNWVGNRMDALGFRMNGTDKADHGAHGIRVYDPDKAAAWINSGGRHLIESKVAERRGQGRLRLVS